MAANPNSSISTTEYTTLPLRTIRTDGGTQSRVMIDWTTVADYAEALAEGVDLPPIIVFGDGADYWLADGFHRFYAAQQLGLAEMDAQVHAGSVREARLFSAGANTSHGLRRTNEDKRNAVLMLLNDPEWARWSDREIARRCGVSHNFATDIRKSLSSDDSDERTYTDRYGNVTTMNTANIGRPSESADDGPRLFDDVDPLTDAWGSRANATDAQKAQYLRHLEEMSAVAQDFIRREQEQQRIEPSRPANFSSASNEWYTPSEYVGAAREVMGAIDLDPASNPLANETVQAARYYTEEDDGLAVTWGGRVWLNPPYGTTDGESNAGVWARKLITDYQNGHVSEAVLLVNANTERKWFAQLWDFPICFTNHRIQFYTPDGVGAQPVDGNALVYLGPNPERFVSVFSRFGDVAGSFTREVARV